MGTELVLPTRPQVRPVSWSWTRGISSGFPKVWHLTLLPSAPPPPVGWPLFHLGPQICHTELLLSPSHISHTRFLFQSSKYPPTTPNKVCLTPLGPRSACEAGLTLASPPRLYHPQCQVQSPGTSSSTQVWTVTCSIQVLKEETADVMESTWWPREGPR